MVSRASIAVGLLGVGVAVAAFFGLHYANQDKAMAQDTPAWNADSLGEAEQLAGFAIASPAFVPEGFDSASKIMISKVGKSTGAFYTVNRVWRSGTDKGLYFTLMQSPKHFELGGGQAALVNGKPGQRLLAETATGSNPLLTLAWEHDGAFFALGVILGGPLDESVAQNIALSVAVR